MLLSSTHLVPQSLPTSPHLPSILRLPFLSLHLLPGASHLGIGGWWGAWPSSTSGIRPASFACGLSRANADTVFGSRPGAATATCVVGLFYLSIQVKFYLTSQVIYEYIPIKDDSLATVRTRSGMGKGGWNKFERSRSLKWIWLGRLNPDKKGSQGCALDILSSPLTDLMCSCCGILNISLPTTVHVSIPMRKNKKEKNRKKKLHWKKVGEGPLWSCTELWKSQDTWLGIQDMETYCIHMQQTWKYRNTHQMECISGDATAHTYTCVQLFRCT